MPAELSNSTLRAWTRLQRAHTLIERQIEHDLKAAGLPAMPCHDILRELAGAPGHRLRPAEIEKTLGVAQYALSRLLDRMEQAGLIARAPCVEDGRGQWILLTPAGGEAQGRMWTIYANALNMHIDARLSGDNVRKLGKLLGKLPPE